MSNIQLDLLSLISGDQCAAGATASPKPNVRVMLKKLTNQELVEKLRQTIEEFEQIENQYLDAPRWEKPKYRARRRTKGQEIGRLHKEMEKRGIMYQSQKRRVS